MPNDSTGPLDAPRLLRALADHGVSHVVGLPDNALAPLIDRLLRDARIAYIPVTREGEAFAIAAGLWIGGASPVVVIQNTGLLESGDSLRGTLLRMAVPVVIIVSYRGFARLRASGIDPHARPLALEPLIRADIDSAGLLTEPTLDAWGIPHRLLTADAGVRDLAAATAQARREQRPVALLLTHSLEREC